MSGRGCFTGSFGGNERFEGWWSAVGRNKEQVSNNNIYLLQGNSDDQTVHIKLEKNNFAGIHFHGLGKKSIYLGDLFSRKNQPRPRAFFLHIRHSAKYEGKTPWERGWRKRL